MSRKEQILPWAMSAAVHGVLLVLLLLGFSRAVPRSMPPRQLAIEAVVVDADRLERERARREALEEERREAVEAEQQRVAREAERERQRAADERQRQEAAARAETERKARAEAERKAREAAESKARADAERKAREAAERKAREEEQRQAREAAERQAAAEASRQARLESELELAMAAEEQQRRAEQSGLLDQYRTLIAQKVERNWARPPNAAAGLDCQVRVTQAPGGTVVDVRIVACNGDAAAQRSIEAAVYKASPLPPPPDPSLFERNLVFNFRPE